MTMWRDDALGRLIAAVSDNPERTDEQLGQSTRVIPLAAHAARIHLELIPFTGPRSHGEFIYISYMLASFAHLVPHREFQCGNNGRADLAIADQHEAALLAVIEVKADIAGRGALDQAARYRAAFEPRPLAVVLAPKFCRSTEAEATGRAILTVRPEQMPALMRSLAHDVSTVAAVA